MGQDEGGSDGSADNEIRGSADRVVMARDIAGDVHIGMGRRAWWALFGIFGTVLLVAAAVVIWRSAKPEPETPVAVARQSASTTPPATTATAPATSATDSSSPESSPSATAEPVELRASADLSYADESGWTYVSDAADFPGSALLDRLARPHAIPDPELSRQVRTAPGAFAVGEERIRVHLQGPRGHDVRVTDIRVDVGARRPPPRGTYVSAPPQGSEDSAAVLVTLDDRFPLAMKAVPDQDGHLVPAGPFFPGRTIALAGGETSDVMVVSRARQYAYEYTLVVVYQVGDQMKQTVVDDDGHPFRLSGALCPQSYRSYYEMADDLSVQRVERPSAYPGPGNTCQ